MHYSFSQKHTTNNKIMYETIYNIQLTTQNVTLPLHYLTDEKKYALGLVPIIA